MNLFRDIEVTLVTIVYDPFGKKLPSHIFLMLSENFLHVISCKKALNISRR